MCEHENTTTILFQAKVNGGRLKDRKYEVVMCKDCNRLYNYYEAGEGMTPDEVEQMFKDVKAGITAIDDARSDLESAIDTTLSAFRDLK